MNNGLNTRLNRLEKQNGGPLDLELCKRINAARNRVGLPARSENDWADIPNMGVESGQAIVDALHVGRRRNTKFICEDA